MDFSNTSLAREYLFSKGANRLVCDASWALLYVTLAVNSFMIDALFVFLLPSYSLPRSSNKTSTLHSPCLSFGKHRSPIACLSGVHFIFVNSMGTIASRCICRTPAEIYERREKKTASYGFIYALTFAYIPRLGKEKYVWSVLHATFTTRMWQPEDEST